MGQPVKLSDNLVGDARAIVQFSQRSIAGQIEFWADLGKSIEPLLRGDRMVVLQAAGAEGSLSKIIAEADTAKGRKRVESFLSKRPYPHYKPVPGATDLFDSPTTKTSSSFRANSTRRVGFRKVSRRSNVTTSGDTLICAATPKFRSSTTRRSISRKVLAPSPREKNGASSIARAGSSFPRPTTKCKVSARVLPPSRKTAS